MEITLRNTGRRFNRDWIFRSIDHTFIHGEPQAILGPNGSGKSTLLQLIAGSLSPSQGQISYCHQGKAIAVDELFPFLSFAAPYLELIEEFSLEELIQFHFKFKNYHPEVNTEAIIDLLQFDKVRHRPLKNYSSGMKQRVKLALAFCSDTPLLLLDEPTANLDQQGVDWYLKLIHQFTADRLTIICSNQEHEYGFCKRRLFVMDYKQA